MATDVTSDLDQFRDFLDKRQQGGASFSSLDEAVDEFRRLEHELRELKSKLQLAEEQVNQGRIGPFDAQVTMRQVKRRLVNNDRAE